MGPVCRPAHAACLVATKGSDSGTFDPGPNFFLHAANYRVANLSQRIWLILFDIRIRQGPASRFRYLDFNLRLRTKFSFADFT